MHSGKKQGKCRNAADAHTVLLIAFHYPPVRESSGLQRTLRFSTYLGDYGWRPVVLTVNPRAYESTGDDQLGDIPRSVVVKRAFGLDTARHLSIGGRYLSWMAQPDRWASWWPAGVLQGLWLIKRYRPAVIMSTFPIMSAHLIGLTLRRLTGVPWIADCRDSMTEPDYPVDPTTWKIHRRLERAVVNRCSRAVFTTPGTRTMYVERYPEIPDERWAVIENGFDEGNFADALAGLDGTERNPERKLTLLHSGVLYPEYRDPSAFFAALRLLAEEGSVERRAVRVILRASGSTELYRRLLAEYGIEDMVELAPSIGYAVALAEMLNADGLLIFQSSYCNHQIPAKLYEYFRAGRPVLGLTDPKGDTAAAMRAAGLDTIADITDSEDIARLLRQFYAGSKDGTNVGVKRSVADTYSRRLRTRELARLLDTVAGTTR